MSTPSIVLSCFFLQGVWGGYYFTIGGQVESKKLNDVTLSSKIGNLDSLHWIEARDKSSSNDIIVSVS